MALERRSGTDTSATIALPRVALPEVLQAMQDCGFGSPLRTRLALLGAGLLLLVALAALPAKAQGTRQRIAYVIGNAAYVNETPLVNPHNDTRLIAGVLRNELRFDQVIERRDLTRAQMFDLVSDIRRRARGADAVFVYYSGHGMRGAGGNYLVPVDARISEEEHLRRDAVPAADLVSALQDTDARVAILVLDACRDNPYSRRTRSAAKGLARMNVTGGNILVAYATGDGLTADDGSGANSPYAKALAEQLRDTGRPVLAQFDRVRRTTMSLTQNKQNPTREGDLESDVFLLTPAPGSAAVVAIAPRVAPAPAPAPSPTPSLPDLMVRIGHVAPTSGAIAHLGRDNEMGALLAIEELNARGVQVGGRRARFELVTRDDAGDPKTGVAAAEQLVAAGVSAVVGHLHSGTSIPAAKVYAQANIAQVSPSATNPRFTNLGYPTTFRMVVNDQILGRALGRLAVQTFNGARIAIVDDRTAYGTGIADEFEQGVKAAGGTIVAREYTNDKATDFSSILTSFRQKQPDLVFVGGMDAVAGLLLRQMRGIGMTPQLMGGDGICSGELPKLTGDQRGADKVICAEAGGVPAAMTAAMEAFNAKFKARFKTDVQVYAPYTYDAVNLIAEAVQRAGSASPEKILAAMPRTDHRGITNQTRFNGKGDPTAPYFTTYTYRNGARTQLDVVRANN